ncbi:MAG: hypothetical protein UX77_C0018G0002 [Parcubacteria group bacterium GW2011_GWA1_47_11]|nr:MAG: hypothetical protein UX77_C0018G0002 [Parcubacteria group bacterium GW2011_GWA1_47_11]
MSKNRGFVQLLPLVLLAAFATTMFVIVGAVQQRQQIADIRSQAGVMNAALCQAEGGTWGGGRCNWPSAPAPVVTQMPKSSPAPTKPPTVIYSTITPPPAQTTPPPPKPPATTIVSQSSYVPPPSVTSAPTPTKTLNQCFLQCQEDLVCTQGCLRTGDVIIPIPTISTATPIDCAGSGERSFGKPCCVGFAVSSDGTCQRTTSLLLSNGSPCPSDPRDCHAGYCTQYRDPGDNTLGFFCGGAPASAEPLATRAPSPVYRSLYDQCLGQGNTPTECRIYLSPTPPAEIKYSFDGTNCRVDPGGNLTFIECYEHRRAVQTIIAPTPTPTTTAQQIGSTCGNSRCDGMPGDLICPWECIGTNSFLAGTLISTADGEVAIETLNVGDRVVAFDSSTGAMREETVDRLIRYQSDHYYIVILENGVRLNVTGRHPVYRGAEYRSPYPDSLTGKRQHDGFEAVSRLQVGDILYIEIGGVLSPTSIRLIRKVDIPIQVYNLRVSGVNTYFAQGVAVHNKTQTHRNTSSGWTSSAVCADWRSVSGNES